MMARNIAPGLKRHFRIEDLPFHDRSLDEKAREQAESRIYPSGNYTIIASDIDPAMIRIAESNAHRA